MFQKIINFFKEENPCEEWPILSINTPSVDTESRRIGDLQIGDELSQAIVCGKPDDIEKHDEGGFHLIYARAGFILDFDESGLSAVAFLVADDSCQPKSSKLAYCEPIVDSFAMNSATEAGEIESNFGRPVSIDEDTEEIILFYQLGELTVEFELGCSGKLKRINIYPLEVS